MKYLICFIFLLLVLMSCEQAVTIHEKHEPVLQIDAVFFSGEPLPVIKIKRTFDTSGNLPFEIDLYSILVENASVTLLHNGQPVPVSEESIGNYRPQSNQLVQKGDRFEIHVQKGNMSASATAQVPFFDEGSINLTVFGQVTLVRSNVGNAGTMWVGTIPLKWEQPFKAAYTAFQLYTESENTWLDPGEFENDATYNPFRFVKLLARDFNEVSKIQVDLFPKVYFPLDEHPGSGSHTVEIHRTLVIPEPIYETWEFTRSTDLIPVTVTNVKGGVGLFIGAIRKKETLQIDIIISLQNTN